MISAKRNRYSEKPITVPNSCPFKEEILLEAEKLRQQIIDDKMQKKQISKEQRLTTKRKIVDTSLNDLSIKAIKLADEFNRKVVYLLK
jgi:hypothetical protein